MLSCLVHDYSIMTEKCITVPKSNKTCISSMIVRFEMAGRRCITEDETLRILTSILGSTILFLLWFHVVLMSQQLLLEALSEN